MDDLIQAIRVAVANDATADQKEIGAQACRTILSALGTEPGKTLILPGTPKASPLAGISADQALDLLIAKLAPLAEAREAPTAQRPAAPQARGPRIPLVPQPPRIAPSPSGSRSRRR